MQWWKCLSCGRKARAGKPFDFKPFAKFPIAPNCPYCFEKGSMRPIKKEDDAIVSSSPVSVSPSLRSRTGASVTLKFVIGGK